MSLTWDYQADALTADGDLEGLRRSSLVPVLGFPDSLLRPQNVDSYAQERTTAVVAKQVRAIISKPSEVLWLQS